MADITRKEVYRNAILDMQDLTITEIADDGVKTYNLLDALDKWDGQLGITLTIEKKDSLTPDE